MKVLVIEDDKQVTESIFLVFRIRWPEAVVVATDSGVKGVEMVETESPNIVILDIGLVDMDGFEVLRQIRLFSDVPVVILTGRAIQEIDRIKGFDLGADDYVLKPFSTGDFLARVRNALSHTRLVAGADNTLFTAGSLAIDFGNHIVRVRSNTVDLTHLEYRLLVLLARNAGRLLTYRELLARLWGEGYEDTSVLRTCVSRLRQKMVSAGAEPNIITSERDTGYRLVAPE